MKRHFLLHKFLCILLIALVSSCGSVKDIEYFQDAVKFNETAHLNDSSLYEIRVKPNDNLLITVSSINPLAAEPFNTISFERTTSVNALDWQGYLVDDSGYINFPVLGKLYVADMTKDQLISLLETKIKGYFDDPIVNVRFMNYSITVMGEVVKPGVYTITDEKITVTQALALAGDLTVYGRRGEVLIARVENGQKQFHNINLKDPKVFNSPYYYLQQNDIIYIPPNKAQAGRSVYNQTWATVISLTSLIFTMGNLIYNISK